MTDAQWTASGSRSAGMNGSQVCGMSFMRNRDWVGIFGGRGLGGACRPRKYRWLMWAEHNSLDGFLPEVLKQLIDRAVNELLDF